MRGVSKINFRKFLTPIALSQRRRLEKCTSGTIVHIGRKKKDEKHSDIQGVYRSHTRQESSCKSCIERHTSAQRNLWARARIYIYIYGLNWYKINAGIKRRYVFINQKETRRCFVSTGSLSLCLSAALHILNTQCCRRALSEKPGERHTHTGERAREGIVRLRFILMSTTLPRGSTRRSI